jgi:hypothetical protein
MTEDRNPQLSESDREFAEQWDGGWDDFISPNAGPAKPCFDISEPNEIVFEADGVIIEDGEVTE